MQMAGVAEAMPTINRLPMATPPSSISPFVTTPQTMPQPTLVKSSIAKTRFPV
jgi:hypothetical protein